MASRNPSTRSRSTAAKAAPRKRRTDGASSAARTQSLANEAKTAVRSVRTRASRAVKKVPTDRTSLSIAVGVLAGLVGAGVAIFMNRDRLRDVASSGGERLKKAADDLSTMAHERIDQARDNITRFRSRNEPAPSAEIREPMAVSG
ncbi:hypothetical protein [Rhizorhabdus argentea]|uniref:hypothetical protein n=1 Tax=Rhizorhabdus argentea TaxID=1387174 RepID=UPI0030EF8F01